MKKDRYKIGLFVLLIFLVFFSICVLRPKIAGDSLLYISSIEVLKTGIQPVGFVPMMIVSTYLGLKLIMFLDFFIGNIAISWLLLDSILFIVMGLFFYSLLKRIVENAQAAFLGTIFLVTNYAVISFGLGYMMDIGGWTAYVTSLYFSHLYLEDETNSNKWLYISSLIVGIGGLYKEYSFVAFVVVFGLILFKNWKKWRDIFWKICVSGLLSFGPFFVLNVYGFLAFNYTYIDWLFYNHNLYAYQNRVIEFIKSFGSIYNFGWFLFVGGFYIFLKQTKEMFQNKNIDKNILFIWLTISSCFSVLLWPVVTRVLFITMPAVVMVSSLFFKKINKYFIILILVFYILSAYLMDAFVLNFVNLPF